jgi:hypothetical protein
MNTFNTKYSQVELDNKSGYSRELYRESNGNQEKPQIESSLYLSAIQEYDEGNEGELNNNMNEGISQQIEDNHNLQLNIQQEDTNLENDSIPVFDFFKRKTNATLGKKKNTSIKQKPNNKNKFVDESTLNSYSSIADLKTNVEENVDVCRQNIYKVTERKFKIDNLEEKSELLLENSEFFRKKTRKLNLKMWFSNYWYHIVGILFFIGTIIFLIVKLS